LNSRLLKRALLLFWAAWMTIVTATNLCDALKELGWLGPSWVFASGNFAFMASTTARYGTPGWVNAILFLGVILWEGLAAALFWAAWWDSRQPAASRYVYPAFVVGLMLWAAFLLADEVLIIYAVAVSAQATHLRLFIGQLVTLLAVVLLPDGVATDPPKAD